MFEIGAVQRILKLRNEDGRPQVHGATVQGQYAYPAALSQYAACVLVA